MSAWWAGSPRTRDRSIGKQFGHRWIRSFLKTRGYSPEFSAILKADFWKIFSSGIWSARFTGSRRSRSEEHTSELQSLMRISYAVFCLKKKTIHTKNNYSRNNTQTQT